MTILVANLGTSDLAVQLKAPLRSLGVESKQTLNLMEAELNQDYYLPIGFDRHERNTEQSHTKLTDVEKIIWGNRQSLLALSLCAELGVSYDAKYRFSFRELCLKLCQQYQQNPDQWHSRLRPGRIWGVIKTAVEDFQVEQIYIFITNQPAFINGQRNFNYDTDSIHLFRLLRRWVKREFSEPVQFIPVKIPRFLPPVDQDGLLEKYYQFFNACVADQILVSIKGGTPQMQTALRVQALASRILRQIYLEPQLSIADVLAGKPSACDRTSYWRTQRIQKYQIVQQLLNRWDFEGARVILEQWQTTLDYLHASEIAGVEVSRDTLALAMRALSIAVSYLNFDIDDVRQQSKEGLKLAGLPEVHPFALVESYHPGLNLYTQCRLFWQLQRIADFLGGMSAFYEEVLHDLIEKLGGLVYFDKNKNPDDWFLRRDAIHGTDLGENFLKIETRINGNVKGWYENGKPRDYKLGGRLSKRNFVKALVVTSHPEKRKFCDQLLSALKSLDYWAEKRNQLIHSAAGISKQRLAVVHEIDLKGTDSSKINKTVKSSCPSDQILMQMSEVLKFSLKITGTDANYLDLEGLYYLYSDLADWTIQLLAQDS